MANKSTGKPRVRTQPKEEEKKQEQKAWEKNKTPKITAQIDSLVKFEDSKVKAFASVNIGDSFAVHGIRVIDSDKGMFVAMPSRSYENEGKTEYSDIFHPVSAEARAELNDAVLKAYEQKLEQDQAIDKSQDIENDPVIEQKM